MTSPQTICAAGRPENSGGLLSFERHVNKMWQLIETNWLMFQPLIGNAWDALTEQDLIYVDGKRDRLVRVLSNRYRLSISTAERRVRIYESGADTVSAGTLRYG